MPYPSYQTRPSRLMMPIPRWGSPYTSGQAMQRVNPPPSPIRPPQSLSMPPRMPQIPTPTPAPSSSPPGGGGSLYTPTGPHQMAKPEPKLQISPYMETIYKSIQNIDPEMREEYLSTTIASIKGRLDRYEFRIARGVPLAAEQQRQYDSLRGAYNDIQKYINNPQPYDEMFAQRSANIERARLYRDPEYLRRMVLYARSRMPRTSGGGTSL